MIHLTAESKILLATQPADFRCGIDGLAALCRHQLKQSPRSGTLFVF
ncbi:IS66 family insertion sequence element accessory protein TnpB, partial [Vibrio metschnikovii]